MNGTCVLSPNQLAVLECLCISGQSTGQGILDACGARAATLSSLIRLGLLDRREAGGREPLYHLTTVGRDLYCAHQDTDPGEPEVTQRKETTMSDTTIEETPAVEEAPAAEPITKPRTRAAAKPKMSAPAAAVEILKAEGGPLHIKAITELVLDRYETGLKGKTPVATLGSKLHTSAKKGVLFAKTGPGTFELLPSVAAAPVEESAPKEPKATTAGRQAKPDPKPVRRPRGKKVTANA